MSDWLKSRKEVLGFVLAILVAELSPFFTSATPLTMEEWRNHTVVVLCAALLIGIVVQIWRDMRNKK